LILLILAAIAGALGFGLIAGSAASIAKLLCALLAMAGIALFIAGLFLRRGEML
jgi:uncharacterized membrane protein YtjA (UPF0391 family)